MDTNKIEKQKEKMSNKKLAMMLTIGIVVVSNFIYFFKLDDFIFEFLLPLAISFGMLYGVIFLIVSIIRS